MRRELIQELRGDVRREAIDIYDHIDLEEMREAICRSWGSKQKAIPLERYLQPKESP